LPVGGNNCNELGGWAGSTPKLSQLLPVGGNNCNEFGGGGQLGRRGVTVTEGMLALAPQRRTVSTTRTSSSTSISDPLR